MTVITGLSIGAWISQKMAAFLEENELFVPEDEDDDDDDDDWKKTIKFFFEFSKFDCWKIINTSPVMLL